MPKGYREIIMKTIEITVSQGAYDKLKDYAAKNNTTVQETVRRLLEKFAPETHNMTVEELALGYAASGEENLDWANL